MNISKRYAAIISILLCVALYLLFLTTIFTDVHDTYRCYVKESGEYYHSTKTCIEGSDTYPTNIYEVALDYKPCDKCGLGYSTGVMQLRTIDYIGPFLISAPISVAIFLLLTAPRKEE